MSLRGQPEAAARRRAGSALERAVWLRARLGEARGAEPRQGTPRLVACDVASACRVDSGLEGPVLWAQGAGAEAWLL